MKMMEVAVAATLVGTAGVCFASVESWIDACERELDAMHGFVLLQHGEVLAEGTWKPYDTLNGTHRLYSHSKSFTSSAVGFLVDDGKLDLDERVIDILPDKAPENPSDNLKALRVRDLLTMNVGAAKTDAERNDADGDWEKAFLANTIDVCPGTCFRYDSGATYTLAAIVERRSGRRMMDLLQERMFGPLGIVKAWTTYSPSGTPCGGWGMNMTTRELSKFGQLYLQKGLWNGRRILSEEWVTLATSRQTWSGAISVRGEDGNDWHQGYGFQFWRCRHGFYRADGANGQYTIVMPQHDAVLSIHAGLGDMQKEIDLVWEHIVPMLAKGERPGAAAKARCASLELPTVKGAREGAERYCGRDYLLEANPKGLKSVRLETAADGWTCRVTTATGAYALPIGYGVWKRGSIRFTDKPHESLGAIVGDQPTAGSGAVQANGAFSVRAWLTEGPQKFDFTFAETSGVTFVSGRLSGIGGCRKLSGTARK